MIVLLLFPVLVFGQIELPSNSSSNVTFQDNGEFGLENNVTFEEDERFQDQDHVFHHCNESFLEYVSSIPCGNNFNIEMAHIDKKHRCNWDEVIRPYNEMSKCLEYVSAYSGCYYPNRVVQDFFLEIHSRYFQACPVEGEFPDAPSDVVLTLTLIPVGLIPILVFLVVWNNTPRE